MVVDRSKINILIACEESQRECISFREQGFSAFSCDIQECSGGHPEWHIHQDVIPLLDGNCSFFTGDGNQHEIDGKWDLIIAHPPCTYMSNAGACRMYPKKGEIDIYRFEKAIEAKHFFMRLLNADVEKIVIENPRPLKIVSLPKETQRIQPYMFGHPYSKLTYLWIKGLEPLNPTKIIAEYKPYLPSGTSRNAGTDYNKGTANGSKVRSKAFIGIAQAMAKQWGDYIAEEKEKQQ